MGAYRSEGPQGNKSENKKDRERRLYKGAKQAPKKMKGAIYIATMEIGKCIYPKIYMFRTRWQKPKTAKR